MDKYLPLSENVKKIEPKITVLVLPHPMTSESEGGIEKICEFLGNEKLKDLYEELCSESSERPEEGSSSKVTPRSDTKSEPEEDNESEELAGPSSEQEHNESFDTVKSDPEIVTFQVIR